MNKFNILIIEDNNIVVMGIKKFTVIISQMLTLLVSKMD